MTEIEVSRSMPAIRWDQPYYIKLSNEPQGVTPGVRAILDPRHTGTMLYWLLQKGVWVGPQSIRIPDDWSEGDWPLEGRPDIEQIYGVGFLPFQFRLSKDYAGLIEFRHLQD